MANAQVDTHEDLLAGILGRAFDTVSDMPAATAELILRADFPSSDKDRVDALLTKKADQGLSEQEESALDAYLTADLLLSVLKSKARQSLRQRMAA